MKSPLAPDGKRPPPGSYLMLVNADFSKRVIITPEHHRWVASPEGGVERMMLDRIGGEQARATSLVRYAEGSQFPRHAHPAGEEILVLSGTFSDESGDYPAGWYLRNPPGSSHRPSSREGATIFVKLRQMPSSETQTVRVDTRDPSRWAGRAGREACLLFAGAAEQVALERLTAGEPVFEHPVEGGAELLVLEGGLEEGAGGYPRGSWVRLPAGERANLVAGPDGATLYRKTGHLAADRTFGVW
ncbi:MAG TPA: cupin domain-containing protein [Polyangiaceae bacterium]|nr:cupin domain-containing protein [Polyangiaceae bacterium]